MRAITCLALLTAASGFAQILTLEQAASRTGADLVPAYDGRSITVRGQIAADPIWALDTSYLSLRDATDHGIILRADEHRLKELGGPFPPGDVVEVDGTIETNAGSPMLVPVAIRRLQHQPPPEPKEATLAELNGFRDLGLIVRVAATINRVADNLGGKTLELGDRNNTVSVFLPRRPGSRELHVRAGQRVRVTGLATQYSLEPPHDDGFQIILPSPDAVEPLSAGFSITPLAFGGVIVGLLAIFGLWWLREHRLGTHRRSMRAFHALSEDIIAASSPTEVAEKLVNVLPSVTQATAVRLYLYQRRSKSLERVPTRQHPDPMAVPLDSPPDGLVSGAVVCFKNRTLLNVPDVRRSPLLQMSDKKKNLPRSAMFLPLMAQNECLGVLEVGNARRNGYFTVEEQAAAQHLANQVAASLKLQDQVTVREQLFRSEKLAATGQLISGVASELRAPIESILQLATSLSAYGGRAIPERDLRLLAGESQRASEIVSRLVSFSHPEDGEARPVDVNALVTSLMEFRDPEWKTLGMRLHNRLAPEPALVIGAQGQLEQVFLNLLVHAEQCSSDTSAKMISAASTVLSGRVLIEISYSIPALSPQEISREDSTGTPDTDPFSGLSQSNREALEAGALGLGVCQGIIQSHGGEIRFHSRSAVARFEIDLPLSSTRADHADPSAERRAHAPLTLMLVDPDLAGQRNLVRLLSGRGHRVVPARQEEAADLAQRMRFDAVFWALRPNSGSLRHDASLQERVRSHVHAFVLVADAYDAELARSLESGGQFLLARPVEDAPLDRVLQRVESLSPSRT